MLLSARSDDGAHRLPEKRPPLPPTLTRKCLFRPVIIAEVSRKKSPAVILTENDHGIQTLPSYGPDHPLRIRILPRTPRCRAHLGDAQARDAPNKSLAVYRVTVAEEVPGCPVPREGLHQLLSGPLGRRMFRHVEVENTPSIMRQHDEHKEHPERDRRDREEVQRDDLGHMILQKRPPGG